MKALQLHGYGGVIQLRYEAGEAQTLLEQGGIDGKIALIS